MASPEPERTLILWMCCDQFELLRPGLTIRSHERGYMGASRTVEVEVDVGYTVRNNYLELNWDTERVLDEDTYEYECDESWYECPHCGETETSIEVYSWETVISDWDLTDAELRLQVIGLNEDPDTDLPDSEPDVYDLMQRIGRAA